eukprot:CAMPEP_0176240962 /NCGR_PEP_ID=MMETSP0121_2-20121125/29644_1 /TAXON_ID=160619 /ORGANISM="Kryptoperidinium foliaceum, Strain CCMP 1326" /LENGTH=48 /DNA_ID= /DNA_START= /DNA_END= /DNA_ORIENTATION=
MSPKRNPTSQPRGATQRCEAPEVAQRVDVPHPVKPSHVGCDIHGGAVP